MKKLHLAFVLVLAIASQLLSAQSVEVKKADIQWLGKKIGGEHRGNIELKKGALDLNEGQIVGGEFIIDMKTITDTDLTDEEYNAKLVGHLKSDDFFGVEKYPTAKLVVKKATKFVNGKATVSGNITIKGKTEPISFEVTKKGSVYTTQLDIDRSKFDVRYGSDSFFDNLGDKVIDDIFTLDITITL